MGRTPRREKLNSILGENAMANSKDVVVTGVSTGIGWGTTKVLISKGFRVFGFCTQAC
jgi:ribosomal protein S24E